MLIPRWLPIAVAGVLIGTLAGCGGGQWDTPELSQVRGTLTLDGAPLKDMMLIFEPDDGQQSVATSGADGSFTAMYRVDLAGAEAGPCTVRVVPGLNSKVGYIPPRYSSESELVYEIEPGDNEFNIDLSSQ